MKSAEQRRRWATDRCKSLPLRLTPVRERILDFLARQHLPVTLEAVAQASGLGGRWNPATVYRSLMLFVDAQVVRQFRLHSKFSYFVLNAPGEGFLYLVCTRCGSLAGRPLSANARSVVREVNTAYGFSATEQELALFGLCPACHRATLNEDPTLKVTSRFDAEAATKRAAFPGWVVVKTAGSLNIGEP
jgi:Fe2+ or Zn2+ uptake regulation protein